MDSRSAALDVIVGAEERLLPLLQRMAQELSQEFPSLRVEAGALPPPHHILALNCFFPGRGDYPDEVTLQIDLRVVGLEPTIEAAVEWGSPGHTELDLLPGEQPLTEPVLTRVEEGLPVLFDALRTAVRRQYPPASA